MSLNNRLQQLLDATRVDYTVVSHLPAYTTRRVARRAHVPPGQLAKVLILRTAPRKDLMMVLPANRMLDSAVAQFVTGAMGIRLEDEAELRRLFPDCEEGAMPPFGHLYGLPMYLDPCLAEYDTIWFEGGNHHQLVRMSYYDYELLARPYLGMFCLHVAGAFGVNELERVATP